jgi:hypothetical protein
MLCSSSETVFNQDWVTHLRFVGRPSHSTQHADVKVATTGTGGPDNELLFRTAW